MDLDKHYVLPLEICSPLRCFLAGLSESDIGLVGSRSAPINVLDYQARHGFAGVPEASMHRLFADLGIQPPDGGEDVPQDIMLAAELAMTIEPDLTEMELQAGLQERLQTEEGVVESVLEDVLTDAATRDCLRDQGRKAMRDFLSHKSKSKAERHNFAERLWVFVQRRSEAEKKRPTSLRSHSNQRWPKPQRSMGPSQTKGRSGGEIR